MLRSLSAKYDTFMTSTTFEKWLQIAEHNTPSEPVAYGRLQSSVTPMSYFPNRMSAYYDNNFQSLNDNENCCVERGIA